MIYGEIYQTIFVNGDSVLLKGLPNLLHPKVALLTEHTERLSHGGPQWTSLARRRSKFPVYTVHGGRLESQGGLNWPIRFWVAQ